MIISETLRLNVEFDRDIVTFRMRENGYSKYGAKLQPQLPGTTDIIQQSVEQDTPHDEGEKSAECQPLSIHKDAFQSGGVIRRSLSNRRTQSDNTHKRKEIDDTSALQTTSTFNEWQLWSE